MIDYAQKMTVRQNGKLVQEGMSVPQDASEDLSNMFYAMLLAAGGRFLSDDGKTATFNGDEGQQALQTMVDLIHKFNKTSNHLACEPEALKSDPFFTTNKDMKAFYESLVGFSKPFPITPAYADILTTLQKQLQAAILGKSDVKTALDNAASYANDQLAKV